MEVDASLSPRDWGAWFPPGTRFVERGAIGTLFAVRRVRNRRFQILVDGQVVVSETGRRALGEHLEGMIALHVAASSERYVFIHAGVVVFGECALLLPGRSFAGKSTLIDRLVRRGGRYYSDEYAVLDARGRVLPYPRPLALRHPSGRRRVSMPAPASEARRVAWVVGVTYQPSTKAGIERVTPGRVAMLLLDNAVAARLAPQRVLAAARCVAEHSQGWLGSRGESAPFAAFLVEHCLTTDPMLQEKPV